MNDWYIDRSKNFVNDTLDSMLQFLSTQNPNGVESKDIVDSIQQTNALGNADANPNAALTRLRDHGLLKKNNVLGDSAKDYINHVIDKQELIIDLFLKRPAKKSNSPNVKPFVLLCVLFDAMLEMKLDPDDIFITFEECKEYLIHYIYRLIQANGQLDTNFLAGMRLVIEIFEELPGKYDTTVANLGKE